MSRLRLLLGSRGLPWSLALLTVLFCTLPAHANTTVTVTVSINSLFQAINAAPGVLGDGSCEAVYPETRMQNCGIVEIGFAPQLESYTIDPFGPPTPVGESAPWDDTVYTADPGDPLIPNELYGDFYGWTSTPTFTMVTQNPNVGTGPGTYNFGYGQVTPTAPFPSTEGFSMSITTSDRLLYGGAGIVFDVGVFLLPVDSSGDPNGKIIGAEFIYSAIPEPSTTILFCGGLAAVLCAHRRRRG